MFTDEDKVVTVYSYNKDTNGYNGSFEYYWVKDTGLPAHTTLEEPPTTTDGFVAKFDGISWDVVENHYDKTSYSIVDKSAKPIKYLGSVEDGYTLLEPKEFDTWNGVSWEDKRTEQEKYDHYIKTLQPLTRRQFKLALLANNLLDVIDTAIAGIADSTVKAYITIEYAESTEFVRTSDSVKYMLNILDLTEDQINTMWEQALTL